MNSQRYNLKKSYFKSFNSTAKPSQNNKQEIKNEQHKGQKKVYTHSYVDPKTGNYVVEEYMLVPEDEIMQAEIIDYTKTISFSDKRSSKSMKIINNKTKNVDKKNDTQKPFLYQKKIHKNTRLNIVEGGKNVKNNFEKNEMSLPVRTKKNNTERLNNRYQIYFPKRDRNSFYKKDSFVSQLGLTRKNNDFNNHTMLISVETKKPSKSTMSMTDRDTFFHDKNDTYKTNTNKIYKKAKRIKSKTRIQPQTQTYEPDQTKTINVCRYINLTNEQENKAKNTSENKAKNTSESKAENVPEIPKRSVQSSKRSSPKKNIMYNHYSPKLSAEKQILNSAKKSPKKRRSSYGRRHHSVLQEQSKQLLEPKKVKDSSTRLAAFRELKERYLKENSKDLIEPKQTKKIPDLKIKVKTRINFIKHIPRKSYDKKKNLVKLREKMVMKKYFHIFKRNTLNKEEKKNESISDSKYIEWFRRHCDDNNKPNPDNVNKLRDFDNKHHSKSVKNIPYDEWFQRHCEDSLKNKELSKGKDENIKQDMEEQKKKSWRKAMFHIHIQKQSNARKKRMQKLNTD